MKEYLHETIPNLKPFDYSRHFESHLINQQWVLVNGISKKKSTYTFREDNILEIERKDDVIKNVMESQPSKHFLNRDRRWTYYR